MGGGATHCLDECDWYNKGYIDKNISFKKISIKESKQARNLFIEFFKSISSSKSSSKKSNFFFNERQWNMSIITLLKFIKSNIQKINRSTL